MFQTQVYSERNSEGSTIGREKCKVKNYTTKMLLTLLLKLNLIVHLNANIRISVLMKTFRYYLYWKYTEMLKFIKKVLILIVFKGHASQGVAFKVCQFVGFDINWNFIPMVLQ